MSGTASRSSGSRSSGELTLMLAGVALLGSVVLAYMVWSTSTQRSAVFTARP